MRSIIWFRRDLRVTDNKALYNAVLDSEQLFAVFFLTPGQWQQHHDSQHKISFWMESLLQLEKDLSKLNIPLIIFNADLFSDIPDIINRFAKETNCSRLYFNKEYEYNEQRRDEAVARKLEQNEILVKSFDDRILIKPGVIFTGQGKPYSVFTPFRNNWAKKILSYDTKILSVPNALQKNDDLEETDLKILNPFIIKSNFNSNTSSTLWPVGESEALSRLNLFLNNSIQSYDKNRDLPAIHGTSMLSPYLVAGSISPRQCLQGVLNLVKGENSLPNFTSPIGTWLNELVWRDFYAHVVVQFPRVSMGLPFKLLTDRLKWNNNEQHIQAWKDGLTGYPIVDAAMRQLKQTGWMHNRLRMIVAMFFSKHLFLNWRIGEQWFMENLIDGDFSANNGGWQWAASTGTDAAPYFRIFNPFSQSKRFDKNGEFIKHYCPELTNVPAQAFHDPEKLKTQLKLYKIDYPQPIVEHKEARQKAIDMFKTLKNSMA